MTTLVLILNPRIDQLISPLYTERSAIRAVAFPVTVLEPLLIAPTTTKMGTTTLASVSDPLHPSRSKELPSPPDSHPIKLCLVGNEF